MAGSLIGLKKGVALTRYQFIPMIDARCRMYGYHTNMNVLFEKNNRNSMRVIADPHRD
jgi:hypothetical protein